MRRTLIIALAGFVLISLLEWGINNEIKHYQTTQQTDQKQSALFGGPVILGTREGIACLWEWVDANHNVLLVIFTSLLFVVTAFLVRYTKKLWGSTKNLVEESNDAAQRDLRAYVAVDDIFIPFKRGIGREYPNFEELVRVIIKNFGKTPAKNVTLNLGGKWAPNAGGGDWKYIDRNYRGPELDLAPTQIYETRFAKRVFDVRGRDLRKRENGDEPFFFGSILYEDIYGHWWCNNFCFHFDCKDDSPKNRFIPHYEHHGESNKPYKNREAALSSLKFEN